MTAGVHSVMKLSGRHMQVIQMTQKDTLLCFIEDSDLVSITT